MALKTLILTMLLVENTLGCWTIDQYHYRYNYCGQRDECNFRYDDCCHSCITLKANSLDSKVFNTSMFNEYINVKRIELANVGIMEITNDDPLRLNNLQIIDISYNNITALKTNWIQSSSLKELFLQGNQISEIEINAVNKMDGLETLNLSYNLIKDLRANTLTYPLLKDLSFHGNQISHIDINAFNNMPSLEILQLSHNELTNLNLTLMHLDKLKKLKLSFNRIAELDRQDFKGAVFLQEVEISHNLLDGYYFESFVYSPLLTKLDLSHNRIATNLTTQQMKYILNVTVLKLNNNDITGIVEDAFEGSHLEYLDMSFNNITGHMTHRLFGNLPDLKHLDLSNNAIESLNFGIGKNLTMTYFNVSRNLLSTEEFVINGELFEIIDCSDNYLTNVTIKLAPLLQTFAATDNQISSFRIVDATNLTNLDLSGNRLTGITLNGVPSLQSLNLSRNALDELTVGFFKKSIGLLSLDLSYNFIRNIRSGTFSPLKKLTTLNLAGNRIKEFGRIHLYALTSLTKLGLDGNELTDFIVEYAREGMTISLGNNNFRCDRLTQMLRDAAQRKIQIETTDDGDHFESVEGIKCSSASNQTSELHVIQILDEFRNSTSTDREANAKAWTYINEIIRNITDKLSSANYDRSPNERESLVKILNDALQQRQKLTEQNQCIDILKDQLEAIKTKHSSEIILLSIIFIVIIIGIGYIILRDKFKKSENVLGGIQMKALMENE